MSGHRSTLLKLERERRGWTHWQMAQKMRQVAERQEAKADDIDGALVERCEAEDYPLPDRILRLLAATLDLSLGDLVGLTDPRQRESLQWVAYSKKGTRVLHEKEIAAVERREFLRYIAGLVGATALSGRIDTERLTAVLTGMRRADPLLVADLGLLTAEYADEMWTRRPLDLLPVLYGHLSILRRLMTGVMQPRPIHDQLAQQGASTALVIGRLAWQRGQHEEAGAHWQLAASMAFEAGDTALSAHIMGLQRWRHSRIHGTKADQDSTLALQLLSNGIRCAPQSRPYLLAWLHTCRAAENAAAGKSLSSDRDIEAAHAALSRAQAQGKAAGYFGPWNEGTVEIDTIQGAAAAWLGRRGAAINILETSLAMTPKLHLTQRTGALCDLADAHLQGTSPDIGAGCDNLTEAIALANGQGLTEKIRKAVTVRNRRLANYAEEPRVQQLNELIQSVLA